ncbi:hypothetical protein FIU93_22665 [Labrenzia sp. THAF35]|nr:hypothetical protein FIU93_22665 [Labrenzia sp. THAF35]
MICKSCGRECERTGGRQLRCSECAIALRRAGGKVIAGDTIKCVVCDSEFPARQGGNKYCSEKCRRAMELQRYHEKTRLKGAKKIGDTVPCQDCGTQIVYLAQAQKRCDSCQKSARDEIHKEYKRNNPELVKKWSRERREKDKSDPRRRELTRARAARAAVKRHADPCKRLHHRMSQLVRSGLKGGKQGKSWLSIVPYSLEDLYRHLEKQFLPGMTWDNMGDWHIDHIIPRSKFTFESHEDEEFKHCWAITNLRPLWAVDNIKKSNKVLTLL